MHSLSVPSKTFLVGEYLALTGGPSITLNTAPYFELIVNTADTDFINTFHPDSPAGKYLIEHPELLQDYSFEFKDPHAGAGGFGGSTAQFALLYLLHTKTNKDSIPLAKLQEVLEIYIRLAKTKNAIAPSGADLIGQLTGGITYFNRATMQINKYAWPFIGYSYLIFRTNYKIATHEHLAALKLPSPDILHTMQAVVAKAELALASNTFSNLITAVNKYRDLLATTNLTIAATKTTLRQLQQNPNILACKGCGALGADVILVLCESNKTADIIKYAAQYGLSHINLDPAVARDWHVQLQDLE